MPAVRGLHSIALVDSESLLVRRFAGLISVRFLVCGGAEESKPQKIDTINSDRSD